jgi:uncharacterized caspase-like protein/DNA-binding CsgD family transcriptional regulator/energy-coupling factor transporter ATP-binding protein EcfA2
MARYALVIGIARYDHFRNLDKAATDAAAIAQVLEQRGDFYKVDRLPKRWVADQNRYEVADNKRVTADELFNAVKTFLQEAEKQEVLIYFAGHGFRVASRAGRQRGFLAASDSTADGRNAIALDDDFNTLLDQANLSSLVVLLDCCHAGALLEADLTRQVIEPSLSSFNAPRDFYLITACRAGERSREGEKHGIFTTAVLEGLSSNNANPETGRISINRLFDCVYHSLQGSGQEPFQLGGGRSVTLVTYPPQGKPMSDIDESIIPYRGLEPFEKEQAEFFFGRKQVVEDIWKALDRGNFVAVIGASGSGKSSAVRAGLIPWLEASGWQVLKPIKPGITPLAKLIATFELLFQDNRGQKQLDEFIHSNPEGLRQLAEQLPNLTKFLLVVDQFEEVFTLSRTEERQRFIDLLTQVANEPHPRLAVVTTMRADFLEPCLQYSTLTQLIQTQAIFMPPLLGANLEQAIAEPAKRLGYSFEPGLLGEILQDVGQEPGCLPLLQFALLELWERRDRQTHQLTLSAYEATDGVLGALNRHAQKLYENLDLDEQNWTKRICLKLIRTGQATRDVRQRRLKQDLLDLGGISPEKQSSIQDLLMKLVDGRLLITEENTWVDLAHEALMESWDRFVEWRKDNRELLRLTIRIEDAYQEWLSHQHDEEFLMMGGLLNQARENWEYLQTEQSSSIRDFFDESDGFEKINKSAFKRAAELLEQKWKAESFSTSSEGSRVEDENWNTERFLEISDAIRLECKKYGLTAREAEIWILRRQNKSYKQIASELYIALDTVKKHMKSIHAKRSLYEG